MSISPIHHGNPSSSDYSSPQQPGTSNPDETGQDSNRQEQKKTARSQDKPDKRCSAGTGSTIRAFVPAGSDPATRNRRQTPEPLRGAPKITLDAYRASADDDYEFRGYETDTPELANTCAGQSEELMRLVAEEASPDLRHALLHMRGKLRDPDTREQTIVRIREMQSHNRYHRASPIHGFTQRPGADTFTAGNLVQDLARQFGTRHLTNDASGSEDYTLADISLVAPDDAHVITIQRLHPSDDYRNDEYELYDCNYGVFHYRNFAALSSALVNLYRNGYRDVGGIEGTYTTYYSDSRTYRPLDPSQRRCHLWNTLLSSMGRAGGRPAPAPPSAQLPPPPDFDQPGPSGGLPHTELKRDTHS
ncbi:hypothetical protein V4C53_46910, partial [Paraburkholderia azotifigens]